MSRILLVLSLVLAGCVPSASAPPPQEEPEAEDPQPSGPAAADGLDLYEEPTVEPAQCLGSFYGDAPVIDPDAPDYSDDDWTQEQVAMLFTEARRADTEAYRAYLAARDFPDLIECGYCACGCHEAVGHLSALDCFKDFHGFYCGYCQQIALRTAELVGLGLTDDEVRDRLLDEFPKP